MNLNAPKPFVHDVNKKGKDWISWKNNFLIYVKLIEINKKLEKDQKAFLLLNLMGIEGQQVRASMSFNFEEDQEDINVLLKKFDEIFIPTVNEIEERYTFFSRKKRDNESIDNYVKDLQEKAKSCNFNNNDDFVRDMIILNMDKNLQKKVLRQELSLREVVSVYKQSCIDLERTMNICKHSNLSENVEPGCSAVKNVFTCKSTKDSSVKSVCWRCTTSHPPRACPAWGKRCEDCYELHHLTENCKKKEIHTQNYFCKKCGTSHAYRQCPAYGVTCTKCLKKNHLESRCKNENVSTVNFIEDCNWCGSKHLPGACSHDEACTMCPHYPHDICFQCRENPHIDKCVFKQLVKLPLKKNVNKKSD